MPGSEVYGRVVVVGARYTHRPCAIFAVLSSGECFKFLAIRVPSRNYAARILDLIDLVNQKAETCHQSLFPLLYQNFVVSKPL